MYSTMKRSMACIAVLGFLALGLPRSADAGMVLRLFSDLDPIGVTIADGDPGDASGQTGAITWIGDIGGFFINVSTGLSKPVFPASPSFAKMDLNSVNVSDRTDKLTIMLTDTDFPAIAPGGVLRGDVGGTTNGTVEFAAFLDPANTEFGMGGTSLQLGPTSSSPFALTDITTFGPLSDPYSMTLVAMITHGSGINTTSFDFELTAVVPEPSTMLMAFAGLPLLGLAAYRHRRRGNKSS